MTKKSPKLSLGRETVVRLDQVSGGTPVPVTSICTVSQGPICHTLTCLLCIKYG